jgi:hypothetical protein
MVTYVISSAAETPRSVRLAARPLEAAMTADSRPAVIGICTTAHGILGQVKVASDPASLRIGPGSASPSGSMLELPPAAEVNMPRTR